MTQLLTAAQMRAIEQAAIASGKVTGLDLMERAGQGVVEAVFEEWPDLATKPQDKPHRAVILCGPGNNGGDGFVVARLLKEADWEVEVFLFGDPEKLPPDAKLSYNKWCELGMVSDFDALIERHGLDFETMLCFGEQEVLFIDALFGIGCNRPLPDDLAMFLNDALDHSLGRSVSVDIASGVCADSGRSLGPSDDGEVELFNSGFDLTVTFHRAKVGHLINGLHTAKLRIFDIELDKQLWDFAWSLKGTKGPRMVRWIGQQGTRDPSIPFGAPVLPKAVSRHKYNHGHALILSGGPGKCGAARLAARGALRIGAGVVTVGCPAAAIPENAAQLNAIMLQTVDGVCELEAILQDDRINALCIGPGLGIGEESQSLVETGLRSGRAMVLDADALTLIGSSRTLFAALHKGCVLTPHAGEFARLFPDTTEKLNAPAKTGPAYSKVDATREAAARAGCTVLFKGPDTVIADPKGRASINSAQYERSAPWLATAGSGDVLAGFITGLLARGLDPMHAAETAAWLHVECALKFGPGLIAEDIPETLPKVFRDLGV